MRQLYDNLPTIASNANQMVQIPSNMCKDNSGKLIFKPAPPTQIANTKLAPGARSGHKQEIASDAAVRQPYH